MSDIITFYEAYLALTYFQKRKLLKELRAKGYAIEKIRTAQYTPNSSVGTHFFFYMKGCEEPKRYWEIPEEMWQCFIEVLENFSSK